MAGKGSYKLASFIASTSALSKLSSTLRGEVEGDVQISLEDYAKLCHQLDSLGQKMLDDTSSTSKKANGKKLAAKTANLAQAEPKPSKKRKNEDHLPTTKSTAPVQDKDDGDEGEEENREGKHINKKYKSKGCPNPLHPCGVIFETVTEKTKHNKFDKQNNRYPCEFKRDLLQFPFCPCGFPANSEKITPEEWIEAINSGSYREKLEAHTDQCSGFKGMQATLNRDLQHLLGRPALMQRKYKLKLGYKNFPEKIRGPAIEIMEASVDKKAAPVFGCIGCWTIFPTQVETLEHVKKCAQFSLNAQDIACEMASTLYKDKYDNVMLDFSAFRECDALADYMSKSVDSRGNVIRIIMRPFPATNPADQDSTPTTKGKKTASEPEEEAESDEEVPDQKENADVDGMDIDGVEEEEEEGEEQVEEEAEDVDDIEDDADDTTVPQQPLPPQQPQQPQQPTPPASTGRKPAGKSPASLKTLAQHSGRSKAPAQPSESPNTDVNGIVPRKEPELIRPGASPAQSPTTTSNSRVTKPGPTSTGTPRPSTNNTSGGSVKPPSTTKPPQQAIKPTGGTGKPPSSQTETPASNPVVSPPKPIAGVKFATSTRQPPANPPKQSESNAPNGHSQVENPMVDDAELEALF